MKKKIQTALRPGRAVFYVLFFAFAAVGLYFSRPYGLVGMATVVVLRLVALRSDAERRQQVHELMENIEIEGGEIRRGARNDRTDHLGERGVRRHDRPLCARAAYASERACADV